ncbi:MAG: radical SAM protein [Bacteroidales bacterium]|nr:radical SAM protein [Bacteroidales bacterium]
MSEQLTVIFKPTSRCNLRCHYCYAARERDCFDGTMDIGEAKGAFDWVQQYCQKQGVRNLTVIWHGGEPLLMGVDFIRELITYYTERMSKLSINVKNQIQTNLTLATDKFVSLFKQFFDSQVGFSLDYASRHRVFPDGSDASDTIRNRALALKKYGIRTGAICMMTQDNADHIRELYEWFKQLGIPFRVNRLFPTSSTETTTMAGTVSAERYARGICELIDIWLNDPSPARAETASGTILTWLKNTAKICSIAGKCSDTFLCIAPNGVLLPCGRFDSDTHSIGNWRKDSVETVLKNKCVMARFGETRPDKGLCSKCKWDSLCVAGCLHSRLMGWFEDECTTNRIIWSHVESRLAPLGLTKGILSEMSPEESANILKSIEVDSA